PETDLETLKAFPNPFRPDGHTYVQILNLPKDSMPAGKNECRIYSASGQLVKKLDESPFSRFERDGKHNKGTIVSSGIYFFVVTDSDGKSARGKIAVIR
ncbi:MAG: T9SS type A sorting domain-containing protein, partial [Candidatus Cloacimonetes bacterium]|nr:T9SS type A sorting domain-containing protein [Candidatus Cloacimonadota bacterium]